MRKESKRVRGTHGLESTVGGTSQQDAKTSKQVRGTHFLEHAKGGISQDAIRK
jgi:hypothetical protein